MLYTYEVPKTSMIIEVAGEETSNEWLEAVSDEDYGKLR